MKGAALCSVALCAANKAQIKPSSSVWLPGGQGLVKFLIDPYCYRCKIKSLSAQKLSLCLAEWDFFFIFYFLAHVSSFSGKKRNTEQHP